MSWRIRCCVTVLLLVMMPQGAALSQVEGGHLPTDDTLRFPTVAQATPDLKQGRSLYYQICAPCHGEDASGGGPVPNLKEFQGTQEKFLQVALNGRSDRGMPAWKGKLSEDELLAIWTFVRTLPK
jgi:mono/diheme cytochrome c family protein